MKTPSAGRLRISYESYGSGGLCSKALPFVIGVIGDVSGAASERRLPLSDRRFLTVNLENIESLKATGGPDGSNETLRGIESLVREFQMSENIQIRVRDAGSDELALYVFSPLAKSAHACLTAAGAGAANRSTAVNTRA